MVDPSFQAWLEKGLLNSLLHYPELVRQNQIGEELFENPAHRLILESIKELAPAHSAEERIDFNELACHLASRGVLEETGGREYLDTVDDLENVPGKEVWRMYHTSLVLHFRVRHLKMAADQIQNIPNQAEQIEAIRGTLKAIERPFEQKQLMGTGEALDRILADAEDISLGNLIQFGIPKLDDMLNLSEPGRVITIGSVTSGGKTSLACQCVRQSAVTTLIYTLEMGWREIWDRLLVGQSAINYTNYLRRRLLEDEKDRFQRSVGQFRNQQIWIDSEPPISVEDIEASAERLSDEGLQLVVVDYIQLLSPTTGRREVNREREVADISRRLKLLARRLDLTIVALTQLNDEGKVRESRAIAQDADILIFIELVDGVGKLDVAKQRSGRTGEVPVVFDSARMCFSEDHS